MSIDEEFAALLDEYHQSHGFTGDATVQEMLSLCKRILANRVRGGKEQGAHYWARQVRYWEGEVHDD